MPGFITSYYYYGLVIYWAFIPFYICGDDKPACNTYTPHVSISYAFQENQQNSSLQLPVVEQFSFSSSYHGYGSVAYKQALYRRSGSVTIANHQYPVTREDYDLIDRICHDNPHYEKDVLWNLLLQSSIINQAAMLLKEDKQLHCFKPDVYINPEYFQKLSNAQQRLHLLKKSAQQALDNRHAREQEQLKSRHKIELKAAKKVSNQEKNKVEARHKKEWIELEKKQKYEQTNVYGVKKVSVEDKKQQKVDQKSLQLLYDQHQLLTYHRTQSHQVYESSFIEVMNKREQALQKSLTASKIVEQKFKITPQTAGFLQAQEIDITQFQRIEGVPIQYQVTQELIDVLDGIAQLAMQHYEQKDLIAYCAQLIQVTQQANQEAALVQAIQGANCCHGMYHYLQGLVNAVGRSYQQFHAALDYFDTVLDEYRILIAQHAAQGAAIVHALEVLATAGMVVAPTATVVATGMMIGATAYVMAPVCAQAMINTVSFGNSCITGQWDQVISDLDNFGQFISSKETVARVAEFAGGAAVPTPNLNYVVDQVLSLRPVITRVQNEAGQAMSQLYVMSKDRIKQVYQQSVELLQRPEFVNLNLMYDKILGCHFFDILPQSHPALVTAFEGIENNFLTSAEQNVVTQLFTQSENFVLDETLKTEVVGVMNQTIADMGKIGQDVAFVQNIVQQEIQQALQQGNKIIEVDLFAPINLLRAAELADLSNNIRQLQDLAKYTNNFQNLNELIPQDIAYLNRIYELQSYRAQIKNFLDVHKPYFMYEGQQYFIEDIASYHIHAGDYFVKKGARGGHSNYKGHKLDYFKPELIKEGPLGTKSLKFYNSRLIDEFKDSSIYPETWTEYMCDLKAIEVMMSGKAEIEIDLAQGIINFEGCIVGDFKIRIGYDIKARRIKTHYPKFD